MNDKRMRTFHRTGTPYDAQQPLSQVRPSPAERFVRRAKFIVPIIAILLALLLVGWVQVTAPKGQLFFFGAPQLQPQQTQPIRLLNGKVASLSWILGRDCRQGVQAYLQTADTMPDAALVGTGWLDPTNGQLINGSSNTCQPGSLSIDSVVQLVHSKGGMAYLTITMQTDGAAEAWTPQQQAAYIDKATTTKAYIDAIVNEVTRANYDGVIMDLEGADRTYPSIQRLFATYNQQVWNALKPLHKPYGIALLHKISDHDDYYNLNGFEDWRLLGHSADFLVIMALDQSYFTPGPTVSVPWLKQLLAYTLQTMPEMLPRIIWEFPLYGARWHLAGGSWIYDGLMMYQEAQTLYTQLSTVQIDAGASDLNDPTSAHFVYIDTAKIKRAVWYHTAKNLSGIIADFRHILEQDPHFAGGHLQIAVWYRLPSEPGAIWTMLGNVLPN